MLRYCVGGGGEVPDQDERDRCRRWLRLESTPRVSQAGPQAMNPRCLGSNSHQLSVWFLASRSSAGQSQVLYSTANTEGPWAESRVSRGCGPGTSLEAVSALLAYPCLPSTPTTGSDDGWWAQEVAGPFVSQEGAHVPMYRRILGHIHPPARQSPELSVPSPMSPSSKSQDPCAVQHLALPLSTFSRPCNVRTEPRSTRSPDWGQRDRPPPAWPVTWPGIYRKLTPPKLARSSHHLALHQSSPTNEALCIQPYTRDASALGTRQGFWPQLHVDDTQHFHPWTPLPLPLRDDWKLGANRIARTSPSPPTYTAPSVSARQTTLSPVTARHSARRTETTDPTLLGCACAKVTLR
ncbi:hypothetical protein N658DRAFT_189500 [Parathielavia hyrcaniae]|uniref:Uncharacterized protein n=1 Tax=Parathielavia hyrcaniae TaxID=113614 RepID=A0AAN6T5I7_9PEZI|nr:hypothetical protein N658DRAFT_189500 [Parathielavia hyrcaniae]